MKGNFCGEGILEGQKLSVEKQVLKIVDQASVDRLESEICAAYDLEKESFFSQVFEPIRLITPGSDFRETLGRILHAALVISRAERGFISLKVESGNYDFMHGCNLLQQPLAADHFHVDQILLAECLQSQIPVRTSDDQGAEKNDFSLVAPLLLQNDLMGFVYLNSPKPLLSSSNIKWHVFQIFIDHAAVAIRNAQFYKLLNDSQNEREQLQKNLIASDQLAMKGSLAAKIGHEINNFLSGINANIEMAADLIRSKSKRNSVLDRLEKAQEMIMNMTSLSNGLMNRKGIETNAEKSSINNVINKFLDFVKPVYDRSDVELVKELKLHLPDVRVDEGLLIQVLFNIVKNAVEARPDARILLRSDYRKESRCVYLIIEDNGPGISKGAKEKLFNTEFTNKASGHGYGLAICKDIIEKHHGAIHVESEEGNGARFVISLPVNCRDDYTEIEIDRLELLDAGAFHYSTVIRPRCWRKKEKNPPQIEYASVTQ